MKHILVVDDVTTNLICATEILKDTYEVTTVKSAKAALEIIKASKPDLVLTDIYMPEMDGFVLYEKMKENRDSADIPVIFCTAENNREIMEKGIRLGTDCIRKPFAPENLCETVSKAFKKQEFLLGRRMSGVTKDLKPQLKNAERLRAKAGDKKAKGYLVLLYVEHYSKLFDIFGEDMTDEIFAKMERVLDEELGKEHLICHLSDDTFAFYIGGAVSSRHVRTLIRRAIAGMEFEINEELQGKLDFRLSLSAGIADKPEDGNSFETLKDCADKALYYLKQSGRRGYHFYSSQPDAEAEYTEVQSVVNIEQAERLLKRNMQTASEMTLDKAYQLLVRCLNDKRDNGQMILFSLSGTDYEEQEQVMDAFGKVIGSSLRKGDAAFVCGSTTQLVVLNSASVENGEMVAGRIKDKFHQVVQTKGIDLSYEMRTI